MIRKLKDNAFVYALFFAFFISFSACEKIETENEENDSTSADISSEDIDKNKDDEEEGNSDKPGNDDDGTETDDNNDEGTEPGGGEPGGDGNNDGDGTEEPDDTGYHTGDIVSVSEFLKKDIKCQVWIVGRIVGDCTRSKKYAEFEPPFTHSQAILLADDPYEKDIEKMVSICLTTNKNMRNILNLVDNPVNYNQHTAILGFKTKYLGLDGIKKPDGYKFPVNIK